MCIRDRGKTTTIGKLAQRHHDQGRSVLLAAGDTFRAAAADQLEQWATRTGSDIVRANEGADPGSVVHDAIGRASARGVDIVLADTAGRRANSTNLLDELSKVCLLYTSPQCATSKLPHVVCPNCGWYKGRVAVEVN